MRIYVRFWGQRCIRTSARVYKNFRKGVKTWLENGLQETHVVQKSKPLFSLWTSELTLAEYRIGDYRIIAETQEEKVIVLIVNIGHRKELYQK